MQCVFKSYNEEQDEYIYSTVYLGNSKTSYTFINSGDVMKSLKKIFGDIR